MKLGLHMMMIELGDYEARRLQFSQPSKFSQKKFCDFVST